LLFVAEPSNIPRYRSPRSGLDLQVHGSLLHVSYPTVLSSAFLRNAYINAT
jgi:hypothetical protein